MDHYFEQNVSGKRGSREQLLYMLCWAGAVIFGLIAVSSALNLITPDIENPGINWKSIPVLLVSGAIAAALFLMKDRAFCEYDYILWNSEMEVHAVYNKSSRKRVATIPLDRVTAWGPAGSMAGPLHGAKKHVWCVRQEAAWCLVYPTEGGKVAAVLELSEAMREEMREANRSLRAAEIRL